MALGLLALLFGLGELRYRSTHVVEHDARITAELITISSRVAGWVTALPAKEGDRVEQSQVLFVIDDRQSRLRVAQWQAQLDGLAVERERLMASRELEASRVKNRITTRLSELDAAKAVVTTLGPQLKFARSELERSETLYEERLIPKRKLDEDRAGFERVHAELNSARATLLVAESRLNEARAELAQLKVLDSEIDLLVHKHSDYHAQLEQQQLDLADREIRSPATGVIDRTFVEVGEYVTPGQRLALLHDPDAVWVEANIKETELHRLRVGQPVEVHVDAYPGQVFQGHLTHIGTATTSEFALLPSPNPSGNFTKVRQKFRTRIAVEQQEDLLRPGMMVEVSIDVR